MTRLAKRLQGNGSLQKVFGNTLWQLTDKVVRMLVSLFVGFWIARYLGPDGFGLLNFAIAFVALFSPLSDLGLQAVVVRELVRRPADRLQIVSSALTLRLAGSITAVVLVTSYIVLSRPDDSARFVVALVALSLIAQSWDVIDFDYQSRMHARPVVIIRTVSLLVFSLAKIALILLEADLLWFAAATSAELALCALCMCVLFKSEAPGFRMSQASRAEMMRLLRNSWPLAVSALSVVLYMRIDQVMLGEMLSDEDVGLFSAAVRISESWYFIPMAIATAIAPALTAAHAVSEEGYRRKLTMFIRAILLASLAFAVPLSVWADGLIRILYGAGFDGAGSILAIHAWAGVFAGLGVASGPWFVNAGMLKTRMLHTLVGALVNIGINLALIPRMGATGAAVATLISYSLASFWLNTLSRQTLPIFRLQLRAMFVG